ncbi:MAG: GNAT family N-acetyltransferase [Planctomycetes bacterium]|nr:GNAT family N-acetyltransferase [Planctomycetota bacterium]
MSRRSGPATIMQPRRGEGVPPLRFEVILALSSRGEGPLPRRLGYIGLMVSTIMVRTTHLEIASKDQWVRRGRPAAGIEVRECIVKQPRFNRFLYEYVGGDWRWLDRLAWPAEKWHDYAAHDNLRTFVAYRQGSLAGYYELQWQEGGTGSGPPTQKGPPNALHRVGEPKSALGDPSQTCGTAAPGCEMQRITPADGRATVDPSVEIRIFGLTPPFIGQGLGGLLLDSAIENAFAWGARRVWVHTCTHDHPNALNNYLKSGFLIFKVEEKES